MVYLVVIFSALILLLVTVILFSRLILEIYISIQGPFFAASSTERIKNILTLAQIKKGEKVVDLGSGDGRVLIACSQKGAVCTGYEIDPILVFKSKRKINLEKKTERIKILYRNYWKENLSDYDVIIIYGIMHMIGKLEKKLKKELNGNTRVVSVYCAFPHTKYIKKRGDVFLYRM